MACDVCEKVSAGAQMKEDVASNGKVKHANVTDQAHVHEISILIRIIYLIDVWLLRRMRDETGGAYIHKHAELSSEF